MGNNQTIFFSNPVFVRMKEHFQYFGQEKEAKDWHCTLTTPDICDSGSRSLLTKKMAL